MKKINVTVCGTLLFMLATTTIIILVKDKQYIKKSTVQVEALTNEENYPTDQCTPIKGICIYETEDNNRVMVLGTNIIDND